LFRLIDQRFVVKAGFSHSYCFQGFAHNFLCFKAPG
jgi:hypothetical protein